MGYQGKETLAFSPVANTFTPVAGEEVWTFADYKVNCDEEDPEATTGWIAYADTLNTFTAEGLFDKGLVYIPAWLAEGLSGDFGYEVKPGWYDQFDEEFKNSYNTQIIDFGKGTIAKAGGAGAKVTFAGTVKNAPTVVDAGAFTITGNASPISRTMKEFVVNCDEEDPEATTGWIAYADTINVFTTEGLFDKGFVYIPAWLAEGLSGDFGYEVKPGWYDQFDEEFKNSYNARNFAAGEGFVVKAGGAGATITIKSALAEEAK